MLFKAPLVWGLRHDRICTIIILLSDVVMGSSWFSFILEGKSFSRPQDTSAGEGGLGLDLPSQVFVLCEKLHPRGILADGFAVPEGLTYCRCQQILGSKV